MKVVGFFTLRFATSPGSQDTSLSVTVITPSGMAGDHANCTQCFFKALSKIDSVEIF